MKIALFIWAAIQSFMFGFLILYLKKNKANYFLSFFFLLTGLNIFVQYLLRFANYLESLPQLVFVSDIIGFLYGPILFLYARRLLITDSKIKTPLHFVPVVAFSIFILLKYLIVTDEFVYKDYIGTIGHRIVLILILVSSILYFGLFIRLLKKRNYIRSTEGFWVTSWFSVFYLFFIFKTIINFGFLGNTFLNVMKISDVDIISSIRSISEYVFIVFNGLIIVITGYWTIQNPSILLQRTKESSDNDKQISEKPTPENVIVQNSKKSSFQTSEEEAIPILETLEKLIKVEKIHLDPDLNENLLAKKLKIPTYLLSNVLNTHKGESFNEYINKCRINEAKKRLISSSHQNLTIFAIALDCGYTSESTFYVNFKKYTGLTPNQFKKKQELQKQE